jgi:hypothetical protein
LGCRGECCAGLAASGGCAGLAETMAAWPAKLPLCIKYDLRTSVAGLSIVLRGSGVVKVFVRLLETTVVSVFFIVQVYLRFYCFSYNV